MISDRLEARLRLDPDGDPRHDVGRVWTRVAAVPARPIRQRTPTVALRPIGAVLVVAVLVAVGLVIRPLVFGPGETSSPSPTPSPTPASSVDTSALRAIIDTWLGRLGDGDAPTVSVTLVDGIGRIAFYGSGDLPADPAEHSTARIGDASQVYIAATIAMIDACSQTQTFLCLKPLSTTMRLDDPVGRWWEPWPEDDATTIRNLMEGSSGLAPVAATFGDLAAGVAAGGPERASALATVVAAPRQFASGTQRVRVDTEWLILEEIIPIAAGAPAANVIVSDGYPPFTTLYADQAPIDLMSGSRANGDPILDLDPALLQLVGNAGGMSASSRDLAEFAIQTWGTANTLDVETVAYLTDAANGRRAPIAADGICPCGDSDVRLVIRRVGHAVGWTVVLAFDFETTTAIGIAVGRDVPDAEADALLQSLVAMPTF